MAISKKALAEIERVIEEMNLEELQALQAGVNERLTSLRDEARDEFIASMKAKAEQLNLNLADLAPMLGIARAASARGAGKGAAPPVKYRNPKNPVETWSGRGRRAAWITREMAARGLDEKSPIPSEFHV